MSLLPSRPGTKAFITLACNSGSTLNNGDSVAECIKEIEKRDTLNQVEAVGVNCTPPEYISDLIKIVKENTNKIIIVYPNSGETWDHENSSWDEGHGKTSAERLAELSVEWRELGATIIGGCCRTNPTHIKKLKETHDAITAKKPGFVGM